MQIFHKPKNMTMPEAGGFLVAALTAYYALFELAHPRKDQIVLVHSAAGGVGSCLVQLAKIIGCVVVGVVGDSKNV